MKKHLKKIFSSIYFRITLTFMIAVIIACSVTILYSFGVGLPEMEKLSVEQIKAKLLQAEDMIKKENISIENAIRYAGFNKESTILTDSLSGIQELKAEELILLEENKFVFSKETLTNQVVSVVKFHNKYLIYRPSIAENQLTIFGSIVSKTVFRFFILVLIINLIVVSLVLRPFKELSKGLSNIAKGDYTHRLKIKGTSEIDNIYNNFNLMGQELQNNEFLNKEFINNVSHEFKTPITSIRGYATLMSKGNLGVEDVKDYSQIIVEESNRLANLSKNILYISELSGKFLINKDERVNIAEEIRRVLVSLEPQWQEKNTAFEVELEEGEIATSRELLYHIISNLLANAIKFVDNNGQIDVSLQLADKANNNKTKLVIGNSGIGISDSEKSKIFEKFYRGSNANSSTSNGLGLFLTKKIVEKLGGNIDVDNQPNYTKFTLSI